MRSSAMLIVIIGLVMFITLGCNDEVDTSVIGEEKNADAYVKSSGYKILSYLGELETYKLERDMIVRLPYMGIWSVLRTEPDVYFGKTIITYGFVVSDHPLKEKYGSILEGTDYEIQVHVLLTGGHVIGGTSSLVSKSGAVMLGGGHYSFDGEDLEEITGMSYSEWLEDWEKKYGNYKSN